MKCPVDDTVLELSERQGVEIDYCPSCRGVWLDRGELDKILDRAGGDRRGDDEEEDRRGREEGRPKKKKSSFLSEIFEGFGE